MVCRRMSFILSSPQSIWLLLYLYFLFLCGSACGVYVSTNITVYYITAFVSLNELFYDFVIDKCPSSLEISRVHTM